MNSEKTPDLYDLAIVGAGAAGLTAAIYALRARKTVLVFEKNAIGGQILPAEKISNYPGLPDISGRDFSESLKYQVKSLGGNFALEEVEKIEKSDFFSIFTDETTHLARAVILANGSAERKLGLPGERELTGHGLSYCATCDGALYPGKTVAVYGGGSTAVSAALYLSGIAEKVYLIHRSNRFHAEEKLVELAEATPNLEIRHNSELVRLKSSVLEPKNPPALSAVVIKSTRSPEEKPTTLPVSALFVNIGRVPENKIFSNLVDLDKNGYILSSESCLTRTPGVFCAGDTRKKSLNQLVTATSDGAVAASAALAYLRENAV